MKKKAFDLSQQNVTDFSDLSEDKIDLAAATASISALEEVVAEIDSLEMVSESEFFNALGRLAASKYSQK